MRQGTNSDGELLRDFYVEHEPVELDCSGAPSATRQEFADECDINVLLARYERNSALMPAPGEAQYFDASEVPDLQAALDAVAEAERAFYRLPAKVCREFEDSAVAFVEFAEKPENLDQMIAWGLAPPRPTPKVVERPEEPPAAPPPAAKPPAASSSSSDEKPSRAKP